MRALPSHVQAAFAILGSRRETPALEDSEWSSLLEFTDRTQLTLHLRNAPGLPAWVRREIQERFERNALRRARLRREYRDVAQALRSAAIEFVVLKGFTHESGFGISGDARVQYDIDLLCSRADAARHALQGLGYVPHGEARLSAEHECPMVRPSGWTWRGDYFDPGMPIAVEVHATPWSAQRDRIPVEGLEDFWQRRKMFGDESVPGYQEPDRLAFAALHALRHVLRNDARPSHVYELARFLETRRDDTRFWTQWRAWHPARLRSLETIGFLFARAWFGVQLPEALAETVASLPSGVTDWFNRFAWSPVANLIRPNKDALWLHTALIQRLPDRWAVLRDRLLPARLPHDQEDRPYRNKLLARARYHAAGSASALASGVRWWWLRTARSTTPQSSDWKRSSV